MQFTESHFYNRNSELTHIIHKQKQYILHHSQRKQYTLKIPQMI